MNKIVIMICALFIILVLSGCDNITDESPICKINNGWVEVAPYTRYTNPVYYYHDELNHVGIWQACNADYIIVLPDSEYIK